MSLRSSGLRLLRSLRPHSPKISRRPLFPPPDLEDTIFSDGILRARDMSKWLPMFALANIEVRRPIEVDGFALASMHDARVRELAETHSNFREFLNKFTTEFGQPVVPSIFICRDDAPITYRGTDAIAGFRDSIAMSVIPQSWAKVLRFGNNMGIKYSDYFAVYPW